MKTILEVRINSSDNNKVTFTGQIQKEEERAVRGGCQTFKHLDGRESETARHHTNEQARTTAVWLMRIDAPSIVLPLGNVFEPPVYIL